MSAQKRAQSFRKFEAEPLSWTAPQAPQESDERADTDKSTSDGDK